MISVPVTTDGIAACLSNFASQRVLVLGDAILDEYVFGDCARLSPEAPVPVLKVTSAKRVLGGAANTAANIVALGGHATLITLVGADEGGLTLRRCAAEAGVNLQAVNHGLATLRKTRVVAQQQQVVRLDYEDVHHSPSAAAAIMSLFERHLESCDIVVISDYAKGLLSPWLAQGVIHRAHEAGRSVIVDPRPQNRDCYVDCDYLTPNWRECRAMLGLGDDEPSADVAEASARAVASALHTNVVLTLGAHGICFCSRNGHEVFVLPTVAKEVYDVSGAGDTVVAAFALARACGADHVTAIALANRAASVAVGKFGTATVTPEEILQDTDTLRLVTRQDLGRLATKLRGVGKRIVTINGSFDVLHGGHLHILNEARRQGDVLIVGLNSDESVKSYKGSGRPIIPEQQRAQMLLALRMVDYVHVFDEPDPIAFLKELKPDVHVNGSEYGQDCIESETVRDGGGGIHVVRRLPGLSTSHLINTLRSSEVVSAPDPETPLVRSG